MDRAETHQGVQMPANIVETLTRHDSAIQTLGGQMKTLQGEVHSGFQHINTSLTNLSSKMDRQESRPTFDLHKVVGTVVSLAVLFTMICGGIIYITTSQTSAIVGEQKVGAAEQKAFNATVARTLERHDDKIERLSQWQVSIERSIQPAAATMPAKR